MNAPMAVLLGVVLAGAALPPRALAQTSPPAGHLTLPSSRGGRPAERPTPAPAPVAAPRAPVQQVAPMASPVLPQPPAGSSLGRVAAAKPPVVSPRPHSGPRKPRSAAGKAGAVGGAAAGAAAALAAKPASSKPAEAKPAEPKPAEAKPEAAKAPEPSKGTVTGQKLPRWAGIRYDGVKLRVGPGTRYPVDWIYRRPDQPVRVLREFETWRLIEDNDGVKGWVHQSNLTGRRSFMVPNERTLRRSAADDAPAVAVLRPGVVGRVRGCAADAAWCEVRVGDYHGWLKREGLWGLSPGEAVSN